MINTDAGARWIRAALQVNPFTYEGRNSPKTFFSDEAAYNSALLDTCQEMGISMIAVTDHWCVDSAAGLIAAAEDRGIVALPGFEANSSEGDSHPGHLRDWDTYCDNRCCYWSVRSYPWVQQWDYWRTICEDHGAHDRCWSIACSRPCERRACRAADDSLGPAACDDDSARGSSCYWRIAKCQTSQGSGGGCQRERDL